MAHDPSGPLWRRPAWHQCLDDAQRLAAPVPWPCGGHTPPAARVVLMHGPSSLLDIGERRFDVALCGHTHGGQIVAPGGWAPLAAVGPLSRRYRDGRYALPDGGTLLVSRGVGFTAVPLRLNAPSAITICTLGRAWAR